MVSSFSSKLQILAKSWNIFKNWYLYPIVYFNLTNKPHAIFETRSGLKLKIRVKSTDLMALTNVWLIQDYSNKDFRINNDDIVIDVGSHIGLFALFASQYCKSGKIYCFEPVKENYDLLLDNIKLNHLTNVIPFNHAISDKSSKVKIFLHDDEAGHSMYITNSNSVEVPSMTLDNFFKEAKITNCNFLKLDCEGAEYDIIDSLTSKNFEIIEKIAIECHFADSKPLLLKTLTKTLEQFSFDTKTKPIFSDMGFIFAIRKH